MLYVISIRYHDLGQKVGDSNCWFFDQSSAIGSIRERHACRRKRWPWPFEVSMDILYCRLYIRDGVDSYARRPMEYFVYFVWDRVDRNTSTRDREEEIRLDHVDLMAISILISLAPLLISKTARARSSLGNPSPEEIGLLGKTCQGCSPESRGALSKPKNRPNRHITGFVIECTVLLTVDCYVVIRKRGLHPIASNRTKYILICTVKLGGICWRLRSRIISIMKKYAFNIL